MWMDDDDGNLNVDNNDDDAVDNLQGGIEKIYKGRHRFGFHIYIHMYMHIKTHTKAEWKYPILKYSIGIK